MRNGRPRLPLGIMRSSRSRGAPDQTVLITGGAGFIGCNLADRLSSMGQRVVLFDNLSRAGVEQNVSWLREKHGDAVRVLIADVRDARALEEAVQNASAVFHFAGQVAVTSSLTSPLHDFEVNVRGTLNLLEALRALPQPPPLVFTSTNKVYGSIGQLPLELCGARYVPKSGVRAATGENQALDFYTPYGCSKGAADQYVLDYAHSFRLPAVVFRMSCIYGPHQLGTEDQGWVAHFLIQAMNGRPITLYGDGKQVRDILFIDDLLDAFLLARSQIDALAGHAFNIGGGLANATSLLELIQQIAGLDGLHPRLAWGEWRPGDQRYYVSDFSKFQRATGWSPKINMHLGLTRLHQWLCESRIAERTLAIG
jgi:CDP-paratose 2-epimerase